jgi:catechol 2,3-dioxygenase-like lactoylglutathione lyase family enzyme
MLENSNVYATIPAKDLERAKSFYADKLGLKPVQEAPEGLRYRCGDGGFLLFESSGAASGDHTQLGWDVDNLDATVEELRGRGVVFEEYDLPGFKTVNGIAEIAGERGAWFKDSEGNLLALGEQMG